MTLTRVSQIGTFALLISLSFSAFSENKLHSSRTEIFNNPFLAIAVNPETQLVSGYIAALRTAPGRTDACKVYFQSASDSKHVGDIILQDAEPDIRTGIIKIGPKSQATLRREGINYDFSISKADAPGNCEWILGFIGEPTIVERNGKLNISINAEENGSWIGVRIVKTKRAYFHTTADATTKGKSFVVGGDLLYVYQEKPDWYFVKYEGFKKTTSGWIRKEDILEISKP